MMPNIPHSGTIKAVIVSPLEARPTGDRLLVSVPDLQKEAIEQDMLTRLTSPALRRHYERPSFADRRGSAGRGTTR